MSKIIVAGKRLCGGGSWGELVAGALFVCALTRLWLRLIECAIVLSRAARRARVQCSGKSERSLNIGSTFYELLVRIRRVKDAGWTAWCCHS